MTIEKLDVDDVDKALAQGEAEKQPPESENGATETSEESVKGKGALAEETDRVEETAEVIVTIGEDAPSAQEEAEAAPQWVRDLRKAHRETQRENRELKAQLEKREKTTELSLGPKPTLEDLDYDTEVYEAKLTEWHERKRRVDERARQREADEKVQADTWRAKLNSYGEAKRKLRVPDFEDAEASVLEAFSETQQGIIIYGADNAALLIYALGKNLDHVKSLAAIQDPVHFAFAAAKVEKDLKVKPKTPPAPEKKINGTAPKSGTVDSTLEQLRADAAKTGDYSKVHAHKQQKRQAGRS